MRRVIYLDAAIRDLLAIHDQIADARQSPAIARDFTQALRAQCQRLATLPGTLGRARTELARVSMGRGRPLPFARWPAVQMPGPGINRR